MNIKHCYREGNKVADACAKFALSCEDDDLELCVIEERIIAMLGLY